jgi:hypothetical protein
MNEIAQSKESLGIKCKMLRLGVFQMPPPSPPHFAERMDVGALSAELHEKLTFFPYATVSTSDNFTDMRMCCCAVPWISWGGRQR